MSRYTTCPACDRHVRTEDPRCPFCGEAAAREAPRAVPALSRRALVRGALHAAGAALLLGACQGAEEVSDEGSGGGEETDRRDFASDSDSTSDSTSDATTGSGDGSGTGPGDVRHSTDDAREDGDDEQVVIEPDDGDWRRHRRLPECVAQGTCAAPPYGAPPSVEVLV